MKVTNWNAWVEANQSIGSTALPLNYLAPGVAITGTGSTVTVNRRHSDTGNWFHWYSFRSHAPRRRQLRPLRRLGQVHMRRLETWNEARRENAAVYDAILHGLDGLFSALCRTRKSSCVPSIYAPRGDGRRDALQAHLKAQGVQSAIYYPLPIHLQEAYAIPGL